MSATREVCILYCSRRHEEGVKAGSGEGSREARNNLSVII